jgi:hypothetical protein
MATIDAIKRQLEPLVEKASHASFEHQADDRLHARMALSSLREALGPNFKDDQLAKVCYIIGTVCATMTTMAIRDLAETLDNSTVGYAMATASLLGMCDISEQEKPSDNGDADLLTGPYL